MFAKLNVLRPVGLLLVRVTVGAVMMAHGYPKLFTDTQAFLERFPQMGFPAWTVYVAAIVEFFGGLLLVAGLFTRIAALLVSGEMFVAFLVLHWKVAERGVLGFLGKSGDEYPLVLCATAFLLLTLGAGPISLDRLLFKDKA
jgi:putative oxidoreductase